MTRPYPTQRVAELVAAACIDISGQPMNAAALNELADRLGGQAPAVRRDAETFST
jgi:hypothetical protein